MMSTTARIPVPPSANDRLTRNRHLTKKQWEWRNQVLQVLKPSRPLEPYRLCAVTIVARTTYQTCLLYTSPSPRDS